MTSLAAPHLGRRRLRMTDWVSLLDAIDEGLRCSPPVTLDTLPTDLSPLPAELGTRAAATLRRMAEAEAQLEEQRAGISRELLGLSAARTAAAANATPNVPRFLDTRA